MTITRWPLRRWLVAVLGVVAAALLVGVPTGVVSTPFYERMTPVLWWNYPVWALTAVLSGLILATYVRTDVSSVTPSGVSLSGGVLSVLAVGCPICNKLVVFAVGASGALNLWAPLQPLLGVLSLGLLGWAMTVRLRAERACPVTTAQAMSAAVPD